MRKGIYLSAFLCLFFLLDASTTSAQKDKSKRKSPPAVATANVQGVNVSIDYSQPSVNGRTVWGDLVSYDKIWRTGANEATKITFDKAVTINGQLIDAGSYALFTIPAEDGKWTVIINKNADQWGSYDYKESEDVIRFKVKTDTVSELTEKLTFTITERGVVTMKWDKLSFSFNIST